MTQWGLHQVSVGSGAEVNPLAEPLKGDATGIVVLYIVSDTLSSSDIEVALEGTSLSSSNIVLFATPPTDEAMCGRGEAVYFLPLQLELQLCFLLGRTVEEGLFNCLSLSHEYVVSFSASFLKNSCCESQGNFKPFLAKVRTSILSYK